MFTEQQQRLAVANAGDLERVEESADDTGAAAHLPYSLIRHRA
jgi:hypothetical protein